MKTDRAEFDSRLAELGVYHAPLARALGLDRRTVTRWANGELAIPGYAWAVLDLLERLDAAGQPLPRAYRDGRKKSVASRPISH